jgi:hypothetical protein
VRLPLRAPGVPRRLCFDWYRWPRKALGGLASVFPLVVEGEVAPHTQRAPDPPLSTTALATLALGRLAEPLAPPPLAGLLANAGTTPTKAPKMQMITNQRMRISSNVALIRADC